MTKTLIRGVFKCIQNRHVQLGKDGIHRKKSKKYLKKGKIKVIHGRVPKTNVEYLGVWKRAHHLLFFLKPVALKLY